MDDKERREELTEEEQTEADREAPTPVNNDPQGQPQDGDKRVVAPDEEAVAEAEEEGRGPQAHDERDQEDTQQA